MDTLRADHVGCYGSEVKTPAMDALAAQGVRFERAHSQANITNPSHASILTSLYPRNHGVLNNKSRIENMNASLPALLAEGGYRTLAVVSAEHLQRAGLTEKFREWKIISTSTVEAASRTADAAMKMLAQAEGAEPFFMWLHFFDPHTPYRPPDEYRNPYYHGKDAWDLQHSLGWMQCLEPKTREDWTHWLKGARDVEFVLAGYKGEVSFADTGLGRVLEELKARGLYDRTLILLTADHGENLNGFGNYFNHIGYYECVFHVPLIVKLPSDTPSAWRERLESNKGALTGGIDVLPTLCDAAGLEIPGEARGSSLLRPLPPRRPFIAQVLPSRSRRLEKGEEMGYLAYRENWKVWNLLYDFSLCSFPAPPPKAAVNLKSGNDENPIPQKNLPDEARVLLEGLDAWIQSEPHGSRAREIHDPELEERLRSLGYLN